MMARRPTRTKTKALRMAVMTTRSLRRKMTPRARHLDSRSKKVGLVCTHCMALTVELTRTVMTGEEDETTIFKCNAKVFLFDKEAKVWKERGRGVLKLNRTMPPVDEFGLTSDDEGEKKGPIKKRARLIMRTEGTYVVFLNAALFDGMKPGDEPTGNQLNLGVMENGVLVNIALKVWLKGMVVGDFC
jgi:hypothetical protein